MIQLVPDQVEAKPDRVRPLRPTGVRDIRVDPVIAHDWTPVIHVPERRVAGYIEDREAALPGIRSVRSWNLENVRPVVCSKIRSLCVVMHPASTEVGVDQKIRGDNVVHTTAENLRQIVSRADTGRVAATRNQ